MQERELYKLIKEIKPLNEDAMKAARVRQDVLAKLPGSLGKLEDISVKLAGITGEVKNNVQKQGIAIFCSDNGIVEEGVASAPQSVTYSQTINFTRRLTGVGAMAKYFNIDLLVVDVGVKEEIPLKFCSHTMTSSQGETLEEENKGDNVSGRRVTNKVVNRKIALGTKNFARCGEAMTREETLKAIEVGIEAVKTLKECGYTLFGIGEMGIGNTTTSSGVLSALTGVDAAKTVGRGGGLNDEGLEQKKKVVNMIAGAVNKEDPIDILSKTGGFDIAAMVGGFLGAGMYGIPVVVDGFISIVAACLAKRMYPSITDYMFASHKSKEKGYDIASEYLGIDQMFDMGMRLGEGSGCPMAFKIIETATAAMNLMSTLEEGSIDSDYLEEIKEGNLF